MAGARQWQACSAGLQWLLLAASAAALLLLGFCALHRLGYPFELEWMEGAMVDHAARVAAGLPIYTAPSADHVAFLYTPLLYQLGAALAWLPGPAFLPLRLVSFLAALGCAAAVFALVRRETGHATAGATGAGLFLAGYGLVDSWFDLARNDTLFLALTMVSLYWLRFGNRRHLIAAGAVFCLAFLAKQTALMLLPPLVVGAAILDWRRALWFGGSAAACTGATVLGYHIATEGWFTWFVFEMPRGHAIQGDKVLGFFTEDLLPLLPVCILGLGWLLAEWRRRRMRRGLFYAAAASGMLLASYLSRLHAGGHINVLMYALLGGAILAGLALAEPPSPRHLAVQVLALLQFALLVYDPARFLPPAAHRAASEQFVQFVRSAQGGAFIPFHGHLASLAGKPPHAHLQAIGDALYGRDREVAETLRASIAGALASGRFGLVVLDQHPAAQVFADLFAAPLGEYRPGPRPFLEHPEQMAPVVGMWTYPAVALEKPR